MRTLLTACLLLCLPGASPASPPWTVTLAKKSKPSVVMVEAQHWGKGGRLHTGTGSGFIADTEGLVVTCHHVVNGSESVRVRLLDGAELAAEVVVAAPELDLAVLRVKAGRRLPALPLASKSPEEGAEVLAVGHPGEWAYTLTRGLVTRTDGEIDGVDGSKLTGLVQHSAAIGPGSSGGPLLNRRGEVVGANVAYYTEAAGIGWAVGAAEIRRVLAKARAK